MSASLIGHLGSSTFRLSTTATVSMSLAGSCFSSESALGPFHQGIRGRGGTISWAALPSEERQVQADMRAHLIHRPARDIFPPRGTALGFIVSKTGEKPAHFASCDYTKVRGLVERRARPVTEGSTKPVTVQVTPMPGSRCSSNLICRCPDEVCPATSSV
jgi:hypothetical protein